MCPICIKIIIKLVLSPIPFSVSFFIFSPLILFTFLFLSFET